MRSLMTMFATAAVLVACGPAGTPSADGATPAQAQSAAAGVETQAQYLARCVRETIAANPQSQNWAQSACAQNWEKIVAAGPLAEAILAAAPANAGAVDLDAVRSRVTKVRWGAPQADAVASGKLGADLGANVTRAPPALAFQWDGGGDLVPYDVVEALKGRGATLTLVACQSYGGATDVVRVFNVVAPGRAPFGLSVYAHDAAVAGAYSVFSVGLILTGQPATLASVRRASQPNEEWSAACPTYE